MKTISIEKLDSVCGGARMPKTSPSTPALSRLPQFPGMSLGEAYAWRSGMWKDAPQKK
jgi:hypothetical protein